MSLMGIEDHTEASDGEKHTEESEAIEDNGEDKTNEEDAERPGELLGRRGGVHVAHVGQEGEGVDGCWEDSALWPERGGGGRGGGGRV